MNNLNTLKDEELNQSMALTDIVKDLLETTKAHLNRVYIILALSIVVNLIITAGFLWYNVQYDHGKLTNQTVPQAVYNEKK